MDEPNLSFQSDTSIDLAQQVSENTEECEEYRAQIESAPLEILAMLEALQESSEKETRFTHRMNYAVLLVALLTLVVSAASLLLSLKR